MSQVTEQTFERKIELSFDTGRFRVETLTSAKALREAFRLRFQVFQVEKIGSTKTSGEDHDEFDSQCDHIGIYDRKSSRLIATARLNCSLHSTKFYSAQEFDCGGLLDLNGVKLELGRVCVDREFRKGVIVMLLWRAIASYIEKTKTEFLFGCGSIDTLDSHEAILVYRYLLQLGKVNSRIPCLPTPAYRSEEFDREWAILNPSQLLDEAEMKRAQGLLPSLCHSYFNIGCYVPGPPAFDRDFKCVDFLTVLEMSALEARVRQKMFSTQENGGQA